MKTNDLSQLSELIAGNPDFETEELTLPEDGTEYVEIEEEESEGASEQRKHDTQFSKTVVTIVAYLCGVKQEYIEQQYKKSLFAELEENENAKIIRCLCTIRSKLLRQPGTIYEKMKQEMHNLDTMPEYIDPELFAYLEKHKIRIIKGSQLKQISEYVEILNQNISNCIGNCANLFPSWVKWEYVRDLFVMPNGQKSSGIQSAIDTFKPNAKRYPFECYINWPIDRPGAFDENYKMNPDNEVTSGNVLLHDKRFLILLYNNNDDVFTDFRHVYEAGAQTDQTVTDFLTAHDGITVLVDCENSDPYKLCAFLDSMRDKEIEREDENGIRQTVRAISSIRKLILFNDYHTVDAWDILCDYIHVPVQKEEIERVVGHKSLIDIAMSVGACKEHYQNGVNAFLLASSDSDFWGLMRAMPDCDFLVLAEKSKFGTETERYYDEHGIDNIIIDGYTGNLHQIQEGALRVGLLKNLNNLIMVNLFESIDSTVDALRIDMSQTERDNYAMKVLKKLRLDFSKEGDISIGMVD